MSKVLLLIIPLLFLSCNQSKSILVLDQYFVSMHSLNENNKNEFIEVDLENFNISGFESWDNIIISPLIYVMYPKVWTKFKGRVYVLDHVKPIESENHYGIVVNDQLAYEELANYIQNNSTVKYENITIIIDYETTSEINSFDYLKKILPNNVFETLLITSSTSKSTIIDFIKNKSETDLWIINSDRYGFLCYENISSGDIFIDNALSLNKLNDSVKFSTEIDYSKLAIEDLEIDKTIFSKLKIY